MAVKLVAGINGELIPVDDKGRRTFSKFKLFTKIRELGYWTQVKAYLEANDLWDAFVLAQVVSEQDAGFIEGLAKVKATLGLDDEQVEAILSVCEADETAS